MDIKKKIKKIPEIPGVYFFYDKGGRIIYIGKAANLKKRVASYYQKKPGESRIALLVSDADDIGYAAAASPEEALIYEASLIRKHNPKYNIALKDDKSYPFLKLTVKEAFPRLFITRERRRDGSLYFGPYTNVKLLKKAVSMMKKIFPLRTCSKIPKKPCLGYHIGQCSGPCVNQGLKNYYDDIVGDLKLFLKGKKSELIKRLSKRMNALSERQEYEKALNIRGQIEAFSAVIEKGKRAVTMDSDLAQLKNTLNLRCIPSRIEAFDISNLGRQGAVGSMVTFFNGLPLKSDYRRFRIKTVEGVDDYSMMREVLNRRYSRLIKEKKKFPDLVIIDGGRGHLNVALDELDKLALVIPIISIAKDPERIFIKGKPSPIPLSGRSAAFKLIQRIRDEAHRFAISYQKILRKKTLLEK